MQMVFFQRINVDSPTGIISSATHLGEQDKAVGENELVFHRKLLLPIYKAKEFAVISACPRYHGV
jgi:hypothetical protein